MTDSKDDFVEGHNTAKPKKQKMPRYFSTRTEPTQNPHDPRPRNPKRTQTIRKESSEHRHERFERKHDRREQERENIANGTAVPPPNAGPNWAKKREERLAKYAKNTKRRHKKHEKRVRDTEKSKVEAAASGGLSNTEHRARSKQDDRLGPVCEDTA